MDAHYVLTPPDRMERVDADGRRRPLGDATTVWGWHGRGRIAAAGLILEDATGRAVDGTLAEAFAGEVLDPRGLPTRLVLAEREVRAWREEREPEIAAAPAPPVPATIPERLAVIDAGLRGPARASWLAVYRAVHRDPDVPGAGAAART